MSAQTQGVEGEERAAVLFIAVGLLSCSVCVPEEWEPEEVARQTNIANLCGTKNGWMISDDKTFAGGQPMPCACEQVPGRRHWFLEC